MRTPLQMARMGARAAAELHQQCSQRISRLLDDLAEAEPGNHEEDIQRAIAHTLKIAERVNEQFVKALSEVARHRATIRPSWGRSS